MPFEVVKKIDIILLLNTIAKYAIEAKLKKPHLPKIKLKLPILDLKNSKLFMPYFLICFS